MSMLGWLFGGSENSGKIIDGIKQGADALVFTDEEKARSNEKFLDLYIRYQEATQPQNIARRLIALMIVGLFVFLVLLMIAMYQLNQPFAEFVFEILTDVVVNPTMVIITFYFLKRFKFNQ